MHTNKVTRMRDINFDPSLFVNFLTDTELDSLLSSQRGLPRGVNYMVIGDPGVGKTTIILDMLANLQEINPKLKILFISAEMNEIDLAIYVQRYPKFQYLNILFVESDCSIDTHNWNAVSETLAQGWDIVAIDSFYELQSVIKEEENIKLKEAESRILTIIKRQNKGENSRGTNTTFITIQQVTKSGAFIGSNRLKHMITAMMELRLENKKNIYSDRYIVFSKHRRGDVGVRLYYNLDTGGSVFYDSERFEDDKRIKQMQKDVTDRIRNFAKEFDKTINKRSDNE
ncbi:MAG: hypothetical protein IJI37_07970 [Opitutales bacterium]|nr:hypothetical protein [Opitutales bacterium]